jgi:hypothetical protein
MEELVGDSVDGGDPPGLKLRAREKGGKHHPARLSSGSESPACSLQSVL